MARHHDKLIAHASDAVAAAGTPPARTSRRTRAEVESYVRGFGLSAAAVRRVVDEWCADADRAERCGYDTGYEDGEAASY